MPDSSIAVNLSTVRTSDFLTPDPLITGDITSQAANSRPARTTKHTRVMALSGVEDRPQDAGRLRQHEGEPRGGDAAPPARARAAGKVGRRAERGGADRMPARGRRGEP